jgi:hypothetical protein
MLLLIVDDWYLQWDKTKVADSKRWWNFEILLSCDRDNNVILYFRISFVYSDKGELSFYELQSLYYYFYYYAADVAAGDSTMKTTDPQLRGWCCFILLFHFTLLMLLYEWNMLLPAIAGMILICGMATIVTHSHSLLMLLLYSWWIAKLH